MTKNWGWLPLYIGLGVQEMRNAVVHDGTQILHRVSIQKVVLGLEISMLNTQLFYKCTTPNSLQPLTFSRFPSRWAPSCR